MASVLATLPFNTELLQILEDVAAEVSTTSGTVVHWFMTGGGFTRPFWNGVYGPPQEQHDIDVVTTFKADAQKMALVLHEKHPQHRWAVASVPGSSSKSNADSLELLKDYLLNQYMLYRCGGVRMVHRKIEVVVKPGKRLLRNCLMEVRCG